MGGGSMSKYLSSLYAPTAPAAPATPAAPAAKPPKLGATRPSATSKIESINNNRKGHLEYAVCD